MMTLHTHIYTYLINLLRIHFAVGKWKGCSIMGEGGGGGGGGGGRGVMGGRTPR